ncbi:3-hydroxyacyl-CoA dehydrogenase [Mesorhizobium sp. CO1-1-8]|uniref:3-hydroxyacyl-CoA dehydrogenase n=1 Tax=Mesorhizobium sp. CO1-1-8 TaxID=2876631 RepID=UPI001CD14E6F|nr:3-hydroxyacyl-CoA dehydrogenase [Mesorhizobium sp. CO1-1-8]MBZ9772215.1 3-hydroxyacyl-CoA dehydrogenase [Mesorhizobium sp. CO1-1-8]
MARKVAIVGTGLIGRGWATAFTRGGWEVALWDQDEKAAHLAANAVAASIRDLAAAGLLSEPDDAIARVKVAATLAEAFKGADYAQENVPERVAIKHDMFLAMDAVAEPHTLIGSSTSSIAGSHFLADVPGKARCMVVHPANPPHLMRVVEIVPSPWHDAATVHAISDLVSSIGQVPVVVHQEIVGFVMNRLQTAVINEAIALVQRGVVDPAGIDAIMKHSIGMRWAIMGPFETMDLNAPNGFLDYATRYGEVFRQMGEDLTVAEPWQSAILDRIERVRRAEVPQDELGARTQWRDRALMQILELKTTLETDNRRQSA